MDTNGSADKSTAEYTDRQNSQDGGPTGPKKRRRGSRGGKNRTKAADGVSGEAQKPKGPGARPAGQIADPNRKPQIGDTRPSNPVAAESRESSDSSGNKKRRRSGRGKSRSGGGPVLRGPEVDAEIIERRKGRERNGRPVGRYQMCVQVRDGVTQVAVMEGRSLMEHYVSRPSDDVGQIHGNIYHGRVQNVLPGMEAAFVDISTPKNAVLYRGDVQFDPEDVETKDTARIEHILRSDRKSVV